MSVINNVLELSQLKADRINSNGDYHVTLANPIIVNEGDQVNLRLASLDTQRLSADTIIIPQDLPISITFSTYDIDYSLEDKVVFDRSQPWDGDLSSNPSFDYFATYTDQATLYQFESILVNISNFVPPSFSTRGGSAGSILFPLHQTLNFGRFGFVLNLQYIDPSGETQTFQVSGGNNYQYQPGYFRISGGNQVPNSAGQGPGAIPYAQFTSTDDNDRGSANFAVQWATGFSDPNPTFATTGFGSALPPTTSGNGIDGDVPKWVNGGQTIICTEDQMNSGLKPPAQRVIFKAGSLKVLSVEGAWPGSSTKIQGFIPYGNPDDKNQTPQGGIVKMLNGASVPNGSTGIKNNVPVTLDQFNINTALLEAGGGVNAVPVGATGLQLDLKTANTTIPQGSYDPGALAVTITQLLNNSNTQSAGDPKFAFEFPPAGKNQQYIPINQFLQRTDDGNVQAVFHNRVTNEFGDVSFNNQNTYEYFTNTFPPPVTAARQPYYIGASQFALEYGSAGEVFSLEYAHMPLFNPDSDDQREMVGVFWTGDFSANTLRYYQVAQSSGIAIHDMQPVSFWQDKIGIRDKLIVQLYTDSNGVKYYIKNDLLPKITFGYASLDQFMLTAQAGQSGSVGAHTKGITPRKMSPIPPSVSAGKPNVVYIDTTAETRAIIARTVTAPLAGGFYLVEINGLGYRRGSFIDSDTVNPKINGIVSANYLQGNIVTGFGDSAIPYTHIGNPYVISEASVRILDATGNPPVDLGPNNTIFIDVMSQDAIILQQQANEKAQAMKKMLQATKETDRPDQRT